MQRLRLQLGHLAPPQPAASTTEADQSTKTSATTTKTAQGSNLPFPDNGGSAKDGKATATCYCGAIQLSFVGSMFPLIRHHPQAVWVNYTNPSHTKQPTEGKALIDTFICNCTDCRKITASMFASNFIIASKAVTHLRGQEKLSQYGQNKTIESGNTMTNYFCSVCGTLMYRVSSGFPNNKILRIGTVDDFTLHETRLKPRVEQFCKDRVAWFRGGEGVKQVSGNYYN